METSALRLVGEEFALRRLDVLLPPGVAIQAAGDRPLGEYRGAGLELAGLPFTSELILVGVVLDQGAGRVPEVPEVGRGHGVAARTDLGVPAAAGDVHAAAEHLVDVTHGEGHVVEAGARLRQLQHEQVVVTALLGAAHKGAAVGIAIRADEAEAFAVEALAGIDVLDEEHHMADLDGLGTFVDRAGLVDPALELPGIGLAARHLDVALPADLQADGQAVGIGTADPALALAEAGITRDALGIALEVGRALTAPDPLAQGRPLLDGRRQAGLVLRGDYHPTAVEALEHHLIVALADLAQPPVGEEARAGGQVVDPVGDFVDT